MSISDDMFDKAVNETSFAIPTEGKAKSGGGNKTPLVQGEYLGHVMVVVMWGISLKGLHSSI